MLISSHKTDFTCTEDERPKYEQVIKHEMNSTGHKTFAPVISDQSTCLTYKEDGHMYITVGQVTVDKPFKHCVNRVTIETPYLHFVATADKDGNCKWNLQVRQAGKGNIK